MSVARNSLYGAAGALLPLVASIVTLPLYIEQIGIERYGALSIAWLLLAYFGQADFGIGRSVTQRISANTGGDPRRLAEVVWSSLAIITVVGLVIGILSYLFAQWYFSSSFRATPGLRGEILESVWLIALCAPVVALSGVFWGVLAGLERFALLSVGNFASTLALQVVPLLVAMAFGPRLFNLVLASLASRMLLVIILGAGSWFWTLRRQPVRASRTETRQLSRFGAWVMVTSLAGPLMSYADRFVIGSALGAAAVAAYAIPASITSRSQMVPNLIAQVLFPRFASEDHAASRERCRDYVIFMGQFFAPVVIGVVCLAEPLLRVWLGEHLDARSIVVAQIIMVGWWFNAIAQVAFSYVQARGDPRFPALLSIAELPLYFGMLLGFGYLWGLTGVAAAFTLRCLVDAVALLWRAGVVDRHLIARLASPGALIAIASIAANSLHGWLAPLAVTAGLVLAALIALAFQLPVELRRRAAAWSFMVRIRPFFEPFARF